MLATRARALSALRSTSRRTYSTARPPLKLAVIGSGPSGFYAASRVLQLLPVNTPEGNNVSVDMYERLPTPYGLARYGVAPDHPEVKNCQKKFDELAADPRFRFLGNVNVTPSPNTDTHEHIPHYTYPHALQLPLDNLLPHYNAVLLTYGASLSNPLGVPGGNLPGVIPALALVSWYNGHPAYADLKVDLSGVHTVDVVGQGNVALDVARILLRDVKTLADSDVPESILDVLAASGVKKVRAVGRRGPGQVAFTTKELREMVTLGVNYPGVNPLLMEQAKLAAKGDRMRTRMLTLMDKPVVADTPKVFELDFLMSPKSFIGTDRVSAVEWDVNELAWSEVDGKTVAKASKTGESITRSTDMVVESVGYRSEPLGAIPFDLSRGRIVNEGGRVLAENRHVGGLYAAGWVARGPVGVIASTMQDAYGLVENLLADYEGWGDGRDESVLRLNPEGGLPDAVARGLKEGKVVDMDAWLKIDAAEREVGLKKGRAEREKFATVEKMLEVL